MRVLAVAVALQLRWLGSPVDVIEQCRNDLKEVEATVKEAIDTVRQAQKAVAAEQAAVQAAKEDHKEVSGVLEERQAALKAEQDSLSSLELAVHEFGSGLEARRQALNTAMDRIQEKEALRNAYNDVVAASEQALVDLEKEPLVEDTADAALVREQHLEMKRAALAEEQERLKTVDHEVQVEIDALEEEVKVWQADRDRHGVFKATLEEKVASSKKLQKAVEALEAKASALQTLIGDTGDKVLGVSKAMGASEQSLDGALTDLIGKQGAAVDLLEESLKQCIADSSAQLAAAKATEAALGGELAETKEAATAADEAANAAAAAAAEKLATTKAGLEHEVKETKEEAAEKLAATKAKAAEELAAAEKALKEEKEREPTRTEAMKVVQEQVRGSLQSSIEEFVEQLKTVEGGESTEPAEEAEKAEKAEPKAEDQKATNDFHSKLADLVKQLPSSK